MMCMGQHKVETPIYDKFIEIKKCIHINDMLETGLMYLNLAFQFNVINTFYYMYNI